MSSTTDREGSARPGWPRPALPVRAMVARVTAVALAVAVLITFGLGRQMASGHDPALAARGRQATGSPHGTRQRDASPAAAPAPAQAPAAPAPQPVVTAAS
jgi:hypothetical protein